MQIENNRVVAFHYTLKNDRGDVVDTTQGQLPMLYLHGHANIIRGLEQALLGRVKGDTLEVTVEYQDAYGGHDPDLVQQVPLSTFEGAGDIKVGMQFQAHTEEGPIPVKVIAIDGDLVTVDGNHELAGERLHFSVNIRHVREASKDELSQGYPD